MAPSDDAARDHALDAARSRSLAEATADVVWRTDARGRALDLGRWSTLFGVPRDADDGYGWIEVVHPDDLARMRNEWRSALRERRPYTSVYRLRLTNGRYHRFRTRGVPILGEDGRVAEWVGVSSDVEDVLAAEEALRASEARYRSLAEASAQIVWRTTLDGRDIEGYEAWSAFTGVRVSPESDTADWFIPVHPDDRAPLAAAWAAGYAAGRPYEHPYRVRAADGSWRSMIVRAVPVRDAAGAITEWVGTHTDVTEREAARAALERERALLAEAQRIGQLGSWTWDMVTGETWVSDEVYRLFGVAPDDVCALGANAVEAFYSLLVPEDRALFDARYRAVGTEHPPSSSARWHCVRPDGTPRVIVSQTEWRYDDAGRPVYASGTVQDVTEQVAAEEALRASEERFRLAARATRDVIYECDIATGAVWTSDGMGATFRKPSDAVSSFSSWNARLHPDDDARVRALLDAVLAGEGDTFAAEYRFLRGDGTWANVMDRAHITRDPDGRPLRLIGALADVSQQRELEAQLRQAQKMEAVGQLAGGVAHDFNNLLSVILASTELSRNVAPPGSVLAADLDEIGRAARRGAQLTRQLLAFSRRQVLRPRLLDVVEVVRGAEPLVRRLLPDSVALDLVLPDTPHVVHADPGQLEQVLMNLVVNARDAVEAVADRPHGVVQVAVDTYRQTPGSTVYVRLLVRDDGIGMDAATRARVFEPFFTTKEPGRGTGLGLSTAFGIAAQSGGTISVESAPGHGTTFSLLLPSAGDVAPDADAARTGAAARRSGGETVLLVEDETAVRRTARRVLERHGYQVVEARHGADALLLWEERGGAVDVLLTDQRMPELDGSELLKRLRERCPTLPAVVMSGYVEEAVAGEAVEGPPVSTLDKPFTTAQLLEAVRGALDTAGPPPPAAAVTPRR
ncbi:MAG TPA: PAS domain-containing protein [Gemmatirosa sp.]